MKKSFFVLTRFSAVTLLFTLFCLSTVFYACGASKEEIARKKAIEKTERMTSPTPAPAKAGPGSTFTPARTPARTAPLSKKAEMKADTMR